MSKTTPDRTGKPALPSGRPGFWINTTRPEHYMGEVSVEEFRTDEDGNIVFVRGVDEYGNTFARDLADKGEMFRVDKGTGRVVEIERECLESGGKVDWSCAKHVREGDLSLFYRTAPAKDIRYLLRATGVPHPEPTWGFTCDFEVVHKFRHPLPLSAIQSDPFLRENWPGIGVFYRRTGFGVITPAWRRLNKMLAERNPSYLSNMRAKGIDLGVNVR